MLNNLIRRSISTSRYLRQMHSLKPELQDGLIPNIEALHEADKMVFQRNKSSFVGSAPRFENVQDMKEIIELNEVAFAGRSNVGKSSLLSDVLRGGDLVRVSDKPGKTQCLNFFTVGKELAVVDFPGYGFAEVRGKKKARMNQVIYDYIKDRQTITLNKLKRMFVLIDSRRDLMDKDMKFMLYLEKNNIPYQIILTKVDKLKPIQLEKKIQETRESLLDLQSMNLIPFFHTVSTLKGKKCGIEDVRFSIISALSDGPV